MPYKSLAQLRFFHSKKNGGDLSDETVKNWDSETPNMKNLPEKVAKPAVKKYKKV